MRESEKYRFWHFSRGERVAVVVLSICIVIVLVIRFYMSKGVEKDSSSDFRQFETEISNFMDQVSIREDTVVSVKKSKKKKPSPVYLPQEQSFDPVERETERSSAQD